MKSFRSIAFGLIFLAACNGISNITPTSAELPQITQTPAPELMSTETIQTSQQEDVSENPVIDLSNIEQLKQLSSIHIENVGRIYWMPDEKSLAVIGFKKLLILNEQNLEITREINIKENETLLDFNPTHAWLATTTDRNTLSILDLEKNNIKTISPSGGFGSATFDPAGKYIWLSSMEIFEAKAYDSNSGEIGPVCDGFETAAPVYAAYPSPHGKWLVWQARATIQLNRIPDCTPGARIGHEDFVISTAFTSDEATLVTSTGGTYKEEFQPLVYFWDTQTGDQTGIIPLKEYPATGMAFSKNDDLLVTAGDGLIVWDVENGTEKITLIPSGNRQTAVSFSPDGLILAAADENTLKLFTIKP